MNTFSFTLLGPTKPGLKWIRKKNYCCSHLLDHLGGGVSPTIV